MGQSIVPTADQLDFLQRSKDKYIDKRNYVENEHGFASWEIQGRLLMIIQMYGDGKYWDKYFRDLAAQNGIKTVMFYTQRNPKAFARRFGAETVQTLMKVEL